MKNIWMIAAALAAAQGISASSAIAANPACAGNFSSLPKEAKWRAQITNVAANGAVTDTSKDRENVIRESVDDATNGVLVDESTPTMIPYVDESISEDEYESFDYGSHKAAILKVSQVGKSGILKMSLLLPVSGHVGPENAKRWAVSDTYSIYLEENGKQNYLIKDAKSLGIVTVQELEVPLKANGKVTLMYNRSGSLGPGGFYEGRVLEIYWDGT